MDSENFKKVGYIILGIILLVTIVIFGYFIKGKFFSSQVKDTAPDISEEKNKPKESEEKSLKEIIDSTTAPENTEKVDKEVLDSLTAPSGTNDNSQPVSDDILKSLTAPNN